MCEILCAPSFHQSNRVTPSTPYPSNQVATQALRDRLSSALGGLRLVMTAGFLEGYVTRHEQETLYVLDTTTGLLFTQPLNQGGQLPTEQGLIERRMRLQCGIEEPLTIEDAYALIGDEADRMLGGLSDEVDWYDLRSTGAAIRLADVEPEAELVKHPSLPLFALDRPALSIYFHPSTNP